MRNKDTALILFLIGLWVAIVYLLLTQAVSLSFLIKILGQ